MPIRPQRGAAQGLRQLRQTGAIAERAAPASPLRAPLRREEAGEREEEEEGLVWRSLSRTALGPRQPPRASGSDPRASWPEASRSPAPVQGGPPGEWREEGEAGRADA